MRASIPAVVAMVLLAACRQTPAPRAQSAEMTRPAAAVPPVLDLDIAEGDRRSLTLRLPER